MSIARDLSLRTTPAGIRLVQQPSSVVRHALLKGASVKKVIKKNVVFNNGEIVLSTAKAFHKNACWLEAEVEVGTGTEFGFRLAGQTAAVSYHVATGELTIHADPALHVHKLSASLRPVDGKVKLQVLLEKSSLEVFGNDGEKVITSSIFPGEKDTRLSFYSQGRAKLVSLRAWDFGR